jgi:hypothetical protein
MFNHVAKQTAIVSLQDLSQKPMNTTAHTLLEASKREKRGEQKFNCGATVVARG